MSLSCRDLAVWLAWSEDRSATLQVVGGLWRVDVQCDTAATWGDGPSLTEAVEDALQSIKSAGLG